MRPGQVGSTYRWQLSRRAWPGLRSLKISFQREETGLRFSYNFVYIGKDNEKILFSSILLAALAMPSTIIAQEAGTVRVARLNDRTAEAFVRALTSRPVDIRGLNAAVPNFRVPAVTKVVIKCEMAVGGLFCTEESEGFRCPGEIEIKVPGQNRPATTAVDCIGPNDRGECECEFAS